jgi:hypothetical protein
MSYQPRVLADGSPCCTRRLKDGRLAYAPNPCDACKAHHREASHLKAARSAIPDPYAEAIAAIRAAAATSQPTFAETYTSELADLFAEMRAATPKPTLRTLTDAERRRLMPPDPYAMHKEATYD